MADTIYLKDGTTEYIFDYDERPVLERIIRERLGNEMADLCKAWFTTTTGDEECDMIIDNLANALRDIGEHISALNEILSAKRLSRKDVTYHIGKIRKIVDDNT